MQWKARKPRLSVYTMAEATTGWIEICSLPEARADLVAKQAKLAWLTRYPSPNKIPIHGILSRIQIYDGKLL